MTRGRCEWVASACQRQGAGYPFSATSYRVSPARKAVSAMLLASHVTNRIPSMTVEAQKPTPTRIQRARTETTVINVDMATLRGGGRRSTYLKSSFGTPQPPSLAPNPSGSPVRAGKRHAEFRPDLDVSLRVLSHP